MTVERTHAGYQTRYEIRDGTALVCVLTFGGDEGEPAVWKILLPGPGGTTDLYGTEQFLTPDARQLLDWLTPIVGAGNAAQLVDAVAAEPPPASAWNAHGSG
jgi:hypothetical protein